MLPPREQRPKSKSPEQKEMFTAGTKMGADRVSEIVKRTHREGRHYSGLERLSKTQ